MPVPEENEDLENENPFQASDEDAPGDFSLQQLSDAYAKILKGPDEADDSVAESSEAVREDVESPEEPSESARADAEEMLDDAPCPVSPRSILEAVLFVGAPQGSKLTAKSIAALMRDVSPKEVKALIKELNQVYQDEESAYRIINDKSVYWMELAKEFEPVREKFYGEIRTAKLSQPAIDVLAVVAYHQPVSKERIEKIRARPSGPILTQLVRRQLLQISQVELESKKRHYETTSRFLKLFGLKGIADLPQTHEVSSIDEFAG